MRTSTYSNLALASAIALSALGCTRDQAQPTTPEPPPVAEPAVATPTEPAATRPTLIGVAEAAGSFNTLVAAIDAAGLTATLNGPGPFTVFAPNDAAFAKIPKDQLDALIADPPRLKAVLSYHVVAGKLLAKDLVGLHSTPTITGEDLLIQVDGGVTRIGGATVEKADIEASNGVIHVIDTVLMPKQGELQPQASR